MSGPDAYAEQFKTTTCTELRCFAGCPTESEDGGTIHFATAQEALDYADGADWRDVDGVLYCDNCASKQECDRNGHQWQDWTRGFDIVNRVGRDVRYCRNCGTADHREATA